MGKHGISQQALIEEAARILVDQGLVDYRAAKEKAAARLGLDSQFPLPSNLQVHDAVVAYQRLFGGEAYRQQLLAMRKTAVQAMRLLADFEPRLVGSTVSGAIHHGSHVQLHAFSDNPEALDFLFEDRAIDVEADSRRYRVSGREYREYPLLHFEAGSIGVDVTIFPETALRQPPRSPITGQAMQRLKLAAAQALVDAAENGVPDADRT